MSKISKLAKFHLKPADMDEPDEFLDAIFARASNLNSDPGEVICPDSTGFTDSFNRLLHPGPTPEVSRFNYLGGKKARQFESGSSGDSTQEKIKRLSGGE